MHLTLQSGGYVGFLEYFESFEKLIFLKANFKLYSISTFKCNKSVKII